MSGETWTVNSLHSLAAFKNNVDRLYEEHKYITFSAPRIGAGRSLTANALSHVWYGYADRMLAGQGVEIGDTRQVCKLEIGVPILRAEDASFQDLYDKVVKPHDYETKLQIMDLLPVTSRMSRDQMNRYLTAIQIRYAKRYGLVLESKGEFAKYQCEAMQ